jgi:hypothetical protein
MAFAGIFQPFARLRWIRFGLLMRAVRDSANVKCLDATPLPLPQS